MMRDSRVLVFDLDDTLIRTYEDLIVPLEREASRRMIDAQRKAQPDSGQENESAEVPSAGRLEELLLDFRRRQPCGLPEALASRLPALSEAAWRARQTVFERPSVSGLNRMPGAFRMLEHLRSDYRLFLLTHGDRDFQVRKLQKCGLTDFFESVRIVPSSHQKREALLDLAQALRLGASEVAVIGNRLDVEIAIGRELEHGTIWMRCGEGSEMTVQETGVRPDHVVESLDEIRGLLGS